MSAGVGESPRAVVTFVWFLARVGSHVSFQIAGGSEGLLANPKKIVLLVDP